MITVVDMGISNLSSVVRAFARIDASLEVTAEPDLVAAAQALVLPGVGAFGDGMAALREKGLVEPIRSHVLHRGRPLLGICLGMQLLAQGGEEHGLHEGLGVVPGRSVRLSPGEGYRVPNIGWSDVRQRKTDGLFAHVADGEPFYFAHSFHLDGDPDDVVATIDVGGEVAAALERGPVLGVQFHPEKSQDAGLEVLDAFVRMTAARTT